MGGGHLNNVCLHVLSAGSMPIQDSNCSSVGVLFGNQDLLIAPFNTKIGTQCVKYSAIFYFHCRVQIYSYSHFFYIIICNKRVSYIIITTDGKRGIIIANNIYKTSIRHMMDKQYRLTC